MGTNSENIFRDKYRYNSVDIAFYIIAYATQNKKQD